MSNLLHPYNCWESNGQYYFDAPSGARYVAYFLDLSSFAENLYTFNFDRIKDTICAHSSGGINQD